MPPLGWTLIAVGGLILPIISVAYLLLRIGARRTQLRNLFTLPGILERYLAARGRKPTRLHDEAREAWRQRLEQQFSRVFALEFEQEYSAKSFWLPMLIAAAATAGTVWFLVAEAFGSPLRPGTPSPVLYALLGAVVWALWVVIRGYARSDLMPATYYWAAFRYLLALAYGLLAKEIFTSGVAALGAFVAVTLPFGESLKLLRTRLGSQLKGWTPAEGHPALSQIQGLDPSTIEKLEELGIHTTQELAHSDPLHLLFRSNFAPKVLIDWMDQAFLNNYVGDKLAELRPRGIRGAIELASLEQEGAAARQSIAGVLAVSPEDVTNLIRNLYLDNQVRLIWEIWGVFEDDAQGGEDETE